MASINLIPTYRLDARQRTRRLRTWITVGSVFMLVLLIVCAASHIVFGSTNPYLSNKLALTEKRVAMASMQITSLSPQLTEAQLQLEAGRVVAAQPDWSLLLALLGQMRGDMIVFERCILVPTLKADRTKDKRAAGNKTRKGKKNNRGKNKSQDDKSIRKPLYFTLEISGLGRMQKDISQFVLRLEDTGLFDRVQLIETSRRKFAGDQAVSFRIQCAFGEQTEAKR